MTHYNLRFDNGQRCSAVRAICSVFNVSMKDALGMVENRGFICTSSQVVRVLKSYRDTPQRMNHASDWTVSNVVPDLTNEEKSNG